MLAEATVGDFIAGAVILSVPATVSAVFSFLSRREAQAANRAVNQRPKDEPTIYELAVECAADAKAARCAAESAQGIATEIDGKLNQHLVWHQRKAEG